MNCPFCQNAVKAAAPECPECRLNFPRTRTLLGALPRFSLGVADHTNLLSDAAIKKLKARIMKIQGRFPQLVLQIFMQSFSLEYPFSLHAFWLLNAANFAGSANRGKDSHTLLIVVDPQRRESAIIPGYGFESLLGPEALGHLLDLAGPAWAGQRWADGLNQILDGLEPLLESAARCIPTPQTVAGDSNKHQRL